MGVKKKKRNKGRWGDVIEKGGPRNNEVKKEC
jgi:hypothetical protein